MPIIGIAGGTGSGKTTLVNQIIHELPTDEVCVILQDSCCNVTNDLSYEERLVRRLNRDIEERGRNINEVLDRYQNTLKPLHQQFIEPTKNYADIIPNDRYNTVAIDIVRTVISHKL